MEICKAPAVRLKALNKHNMTHIMYIEMENVACNLLKKPTHNALKYVCCTFVFLNVSAATFSLPKNTHNILHVITF